MPQNTLNVPYQQYQSQRMNYFANESQNQVVLNPSDFVIPILLQDPYGRYGQNQTDH